MNWFGPTAGQQYAEHVRSGEIIDSLESRQGQLGDECVVFKSLFMNPLIHFSKVSFKMATYFVYRVLFWKWPKYEIMVPTLSLLANLNGRTERKAWRDVVWSQSVMLHSLVRKNQAGIMLDSSNLLFSLDTDI